MVELYGSGQEETEKRQSGCKWFHWKNNESEENECEFYCGIIPPLCRALHTCHSLTSTARQTQAGGGGGRFNLVPLSVKLCSSADIPHLIYAIMTGVSFNLWTGDCAYFLPQFARGWHVEEFLALFCKLILLCWLLFFLTAIFLLFLNLVDL